MNQLTGSLNMAEKCDPSAKTASMLNITPFTSEYKVLADGINITNITTISANKTNNQVIVAHTIPHASLTHHVVFGTNMEQHLQHEQLQQQSSPSSSSSS